MLCFPERVLLVLTMCLGVSAAGYTPGVSVQQQSSHSQTQQQAVLGTYSPVTSHQCSMVQVNSQTRHRPVRADQNRPVQSRPEQTDLHQTRSVKTNLGYTVPDKTSSDQSRLESSGPDQTVPNQTSLDGT